MRLGLTYQTDLTHLSRVVIVVDVLDPCPLRQQAEQGQEDNQGLAHGSLMYNDPRNN